MGDGGPSVLTIAKIGTESTFGDGTVTTVVPVTGGGAQPSFPPILDNAKRGVAMQDFESYQGPGRGIGSLEGNAHVEVMQYLMAGIMGAGGAGTYTLGSSPPSYGIHWSYGGISGLLGKGMRISELTVRFNAAEGAVTYTSNFLGQEVASAGALSVSHDVTDPLLGWHLYATMGGAAACVTEGELTFSRDIALLYCGNSAVAANKKKPKNSYAGGLAVTGRLTLDFTASSLVDRYIDKTQDALALTFTDPGDDAGVLGFSFPKMDYGDNPLDIDDSGTFVTVVYALRALYNLDTLAGPTLTATT